MAHSNKLSMLKKHAGLSMAIVFQLLITQGSQAQQCSTSIESTSEAGQYLVQNDGTVIDNRHNLMWTHCSLGQLSRQQTCVGEAKKLEWKEANKQAHEISLAGYIDWRLPTVQELSLLAELRCQKPAINLDLFPNTKGEDYWSSTEFINNLDSAWLVHFGFGENHVNLKSTRAGARFVRTIQKAR